MAKKIKNKIPFKCPFMQASCPYVDVATITALKKCIDCEHNKKNKKK